MSEFKVGDRVVIAEPQSAFERVCSGTVVTTPHGWEGIAVLWDGNMGVCGSFEPSFLAPFPY